jgi:hypothetical protein
MTGAQLQRPQPRDSAVGEGIPIVVQTDDSGFPRRLGFLGLKTQPRSAFAEKVFRLSCQDAEDQKENDALYGFTTVEEKVELLL